MQLHAVVCREIEFKFQCSQMAIDCRRSNLALGVRHLNFLTETYLDYELLIIITILLIKETQFLKLDYWTKTWDDFYNGASAHFEGKSCGSPRLHLFCLYSIAHLFLFPSFELYSINPNLHSLQLSPSLIRLLVPTRSPSRSQSRIRWSPCGWKPTPL